MQSGRGFIETYFPAPGRELTVIDIGAQDVNGSLREVCRPPLRYVGVDFVRGRGVDVVLDDPYRLPFADASADAVLSTSCFEHSEMFWLLFLEILRILKPAGLFYLNAPSNGDFHRYPVDCWRFYPDSGNALVAWAKRSGYAPCLLESYVGFQVGDVWSDYVAVFLKEAALAPQHANRILHRKRDFYNGTIAGNPEFINPSEKSEDQLRLALLEDALGGRKP
jgi:SAM-dependent methyltransferase